MDTPGLYINTHQNAEKQNNSLGNNSNKSFFIQLKSFCLSLQNQYQSVTQQFEIPPGSNPRNYDRGLKAIKSEVADVKKLAEDTREKIIKIQQFGYFVESTKDLINAQMEDIKRMEKYLMRYGYIPPEKVEMKEDFTEDNRQSVTENFDRPLKSPELSEIGRKVIEGNALPILTNLTKVIIDEPLIVNREKVIKTPVQERNSKWYMTPSPDVTSRSKVEKWIECVEAAVDSVTPVCKSVKNALLFENEDSSCDSPKYTLYDDMNLVKTCTSKDVTTTAPKSPIISRTDYSFIERPNHFQDTTPEEPILSSQSKNRQNIVQTITPEEPILLLQSKNQQSIYQDSTPEEPILLSQSKNRQHMKDRTPEEPLLLSQTKYHKGKERMNSNSHSVFCESLSPQLSDITLKVLNQRHMDPYSDKKITNVISHNYSKEKTFQDMEPESPKLSDVTLKVLQKHSRIF